MKIESFRKINPVKWPPLIFFKYTKKIFFKLFYIFSPVNLKIKSELDYLYKYGRAI